VPLLAAARGFQPRLESCGLADAHIQKGSSRDAQLGRTTGPAGGQIGHPCAASQYRDQGRIETTELVAWAIGYIVTEG
jgi:hypothetical protein